MENFISFDTFVFLRESNEHVNVKLNKNVGGDSLLNRIAALDESTYPIFESFTNEERHDIDNRLWEAIIESAVTGQQITESILGKVFTGIKNMGKKAAKWVGKMVNNMGTLFEGLVDYAKQFLSAISKKGESLAKGVWGKVKTMSEEKILGRFKIVEESINLNEGDINAKAAGEEIDHFSGCIDYLRDKGSNSSFEAGAKEGAAAFKASVGEADKEEKEKIQAQVNKKLKESESFNRDLITWTVNKIREDENFDINELLIIAEYNQLITEGDTESSKEAAAEKKKSLFSKIKSGLSLSNILAVIMSGIVWLFEQVVKLLSNGALNSFAKFVEKRGGPKAIKYASIGMIIGVILGFAVEVFATSYHGHDMLGEIAHGLHNANPSYWIGKGIELIIDGGLPWLKFVVLGAVAVMGTMHIIAAIKGGKAKPEDSKDKESKTDSDGEKKE